MKKIFVILIAGMLSACATSKGSSYTFEIQEDGILQGHVVEADLSNSLVIVNPEVN